MKTSFPPMRIKIAASQIMEKWCIYQAYEYFIVIAVCIKNFEIELTRAWLENGEFKNSCIIDNYLLYTRFSTYLYTNESRNSKSMVLEILFRIISLFVCILRLI